MYGSPVGTILVTGAGGNRQLITTTNTIQGTTIPPVRVFNMHILSSGGGAAVVSLSNGADLAGANGTIWITETGTSTTGKTFDYGIQGHLFPNGCYVTVDSNTTSVAISCREDLA